MRIIKCTVCLFYVVSNCAKVSVTGADNVCANNTTGKLEFGMDCTTNTQCTTDVCHYTRCSCPVGTSYDSCSAKCTPKNEYMISSLDLPLGNHYDWTFIGPVGSYVTLVLYDVDFNTNNRQNNFIHVTSMYDTFLINFCAKNDSTVRYFASRNHVMGFTYRLTDSGYRGFRGMYFMQSNHNILTNSSGYIISPGFPNGYFNNLSITWHISAKAGHFVSLRYTDVFKRDIKLFKIDTYNWEIVALDRSTWRVSINDGSRFADAIHNSSTKKCESAMVTHREVKRYLKHTPSNNVNVNIHGEYWHSPDYGLSKLLEINITAMHDFVYVFDGPSILSKQIFNFTGTNLTRRNLTSTSNNMLIMFRSYWSYSGTGVLALYTMLGQAHGHVCNTTHQCSKDLVCLGQVCSCHVDFFYDVTTKQCKKNELPECKNTSQWKDASSYSNGTSISSNLSFANSSLSALAGNNEDKEDTVKIALIVVAALGWFVALAALVTMTINCLRNEKNKGTQANEQSVMSVTVKATKNEYKNLSQSVQRQPEEEIYVNAVESHRQVNPVVQLNSRLESNQTSTDNDNNVYDEVKFTYSKHIPDTNVYRNIES